MRIKGVFNVILRTLVSLRPAFYMEVVAIILISIGLSLHFTSYAALGYGMNRFTVLLSISSILLLLFLAINSTVVGNQFTNVFIVMVSTVFILFAGLLHISRTLSNIGIYFTVNMGNAEANAAGVPPAIAATIMFVLAAILVVVSAFFKNMKDNASLLEHIKSEKEMGDAS